MVGTLVELAVAAAFVVEAAAGRTELLRTVAAVPAEVDRSSVAPVADVVAAVVAGEALAAASSAALQKVGKSCAAAGSSTVPV